MEEAAAEVEEDHAPWLAALAAHERHGLSSGWTGWSSMEDAVADKGKQVVAAEEEEDHAPWLAAIGAPEFVDLSSTWSQKASDPWAASSAVGQPQMKLLTDAQICRRKKKNRKNRERAERKRTGGKIWSPADIETFDSSDDDDANEVIIDLASTVVAAGVFASSFFAWVCRPRLRCAHG